MISETNPLLVDLVIEHLMHYLNEKDLKSARLVCCSWYFPATKILQTHAKPITFGDLYKVNLIRLRPDLETIKIFMSTMNNTIFFPFVKFDLRPSIFSPNCFSLLEEFFTNFGPVIEFLSISLAYESSDTFTKRCFPSLNLNRLKSLDFCNTIRGEMRPSLRSELLTTRYNLLETVLNASPNIETLNFWCDSENLAWPGEVIEVLKGVKLPELRTLKITFPMTNYQLVNMSQISFQLTSFIFLIREPVFNTESFYKILESQKNTLESLKLADLQCDQVKYLEFPEMRVLKRLEIEGTFYGDNCRLILFNFSFKRLPKIETIILRNCHKDNFDLSSLLCGAGHSTTLLELHVILAHDFVNATTIQSLPFLFPNLKSLHVMFSAEAKDLLTTVFQNLKNLEQLTINVRKCGENIDSLLTGIQAKIIWDKDLLPEISSRFDAMESSHLKMRPGLSDLKYLRSLELKGEYRNYKPETRAITDISAYLAFLQVKSLRNLVLWQTGSNVSKECFHKLDQSLNVVQIHPGGDQLCHCQLALIN